MIFFLKSLSTSVHNQEHDPDDQDQQAETTTNDHHHDLATSLTVWRKSLLINCHGFTVINSQGDIAYRVDNYMGRPHELTLMDTVGKSILTMRRRKKLGMMVDSWLVYEGEVGYNHSARSKMEKKKKKKASWCVKKNHSSMFLQSNKKNVLAYVYRGNDDDEVSSSSSKRSYVYVIEGSYTNRSCKIMEIETRKVVAETKRKEEMVGGVSFGVDVFVLVVQSGFDPGFAMGLVLILDQMF